MNRSPQPAARADAGTPPTPLALKAFVLLGALLLFGMEPLLGRLMLARHGGGFHVWTTLIMTFQGLLLAGYLYCHLVAPRIGRLHLLVVCLPLPLLPLVVIGEANFDAPMSSLVGSLLITAGLPFAVLSTTSILAQQRLADSATRASAEPYGLYSISNAGSLVALLAYPFVVEALLGLEAQQLGWSILYVVYVAVAFVALGPGGARQPREGGAEAPAGDTATPSLQVHVQWFLLSAIPSAFLLAVTNLLILDVGSIPLLWVLPLALYLLSFILVFSPTPPNLGLVQRYWFEASVCGVTLWAGGRIALTWLSLVAQLLILMVVCLVAHAELFRVRPAPRHLTRFYLMVAFGGWGGSAAVTLVAPAAFSTLLEYPLSILALAITLLITRRTRIRSWLTQEPRLRLLASGTAIGILVGASLYAATIANTTTVIAVHRNHYGFYTVEDRPVPGNTHVVLRHLIHGTTVHGSQRLGQEPPVPLSYYHDRGPLVEILGVSESLPTRRIGVIGLGAGSLAGWTRDTDEITFYELDRDNFWLARDYFGFLSSCRGKLRLVPGDGRISLQQDTEAPDGSYHLLIVDAFTSDSIPVHLLTAEALALYQRKMTPDGLMAFNISNRYYDLIPVLLATTRANGLQATWKEAGASEEPGRFASQWFVATNFSDAIWKLRHKDWQTSQSTRQIPATAPWTDDYSSLLPPLWHSLRRH